MRINITTPLPIVKGNIQEFDMVSAGLSIVENDKLLPKEFIQELKSMPKLERNIVLGKYSRDNPELRLASTITDGIKRAMESFIDTNNILPENIVSIKRDAIFVANSVVGTTEFEECIKFKIKNSYSHFLNFEKVEIYCVPKKDFWDVKGIPEQYVKEYHNDYALNVIREIMRMLISNNARDAVETISQYRLDYLNLELDMGFYRNFSASSGFSMQLQGKRFTILNSLTPDYLTNLDISYNLKNFIIPLIKIINKGTS